MDHAYISLNVGGQMFYIRVASLRSVPRTLLSDLTEASLPLDLVFGGKAISEEDDIDGTKPKHGEVARTEMGYDSTGISTNGAFVTGSHPGDRAKYVYLSCSNRIRPIRPIAAETLSSNTTSAYSSPSKSTPEKRSSKTSAPLSPPSPAFPEPVVHLQQSSCLFVPATCLTSPRHKPVALPNHKSRGRKVYGFTNKSFYSDENYADKTQSDNSYIPTDALSGGAKTDALPYAPPRNDLYYSPLNRQGKQRTNGDVGCPLEINSSSLVPLPQAAHADVYIDRNPVLFPFILDLYRHATINSNIVITTNNKTLHHHHSSNVNNNTTTINNNNNITTTVNSNITTTINNNNNNNITTTINNIYTTIINNIYKTVVKNKNNITTTSNNNIINTSPPPSLTTSLPPPPPITIITTLPLPPSTTRTLPTTTTKTSPPPPVTSKTTSTTNTTAKTTKMSLGK
ncbi:hypothetical protein ElyMa_003907900 [Elysia marginata]|uniref:Potassium channel tetramerisation-type BTB domain-containing protein n=1 Tax=Elysia marginata TaxID=1093978 RepID=A0AAV4FNX5_9GAST|nr:hypothetical protein ElyMa_003907900 [Elysia marginata]